MRSTRLNEAAILFGTLLLLTVPTIATEAPKDLGYKEGEGFNHNGGVRGTVPSAHLEQNGALTSSESTSNTNFSALSGAMTPVANKHNLLKRSLPRHNSAPSPSFHQRRTLVNIGEWNQIGSDIKGPTYSATMSRDGKRVAVGKIERDVRVYEWDGSQLKQKGDTLYQEDFPLGVYFAFKVSLSNNGDRLAISTSGYTYVFELIGSSWTQMGQAIYGGYDSSLSDDGQRLVIGDSDIGTSGRVQVVEWSGSDRSWKQVGQILYGEMEDSSFGYSVSMAGDGKSFVVGAPHYGYAVGDYFVGQVQVYELSNLSWQQKGGNIDGLGWADRCGWSVDISRTGDRIVVGSPAPERRRCGEDHGCGNVRAFEWNINKSSWTQMGDTMYGEVDKDSFGKDVSMSDADRISIGSSHANINVGKVRVVEWNGSSWTQVGSDVEGDAKRDLFGIRVSMSGDGERFIAAKLDETSHVFQWINSGHPGPFPEGFDEDVTCPYLDCLNDLVKQFGSPSITFGDNKLDRYVRNSLNKVTISEKQIRKRDRDVILAGDRLKQAMKWIHLTRSRGKNVENEAAIEFSNTIGETGSACQIDFADNFINAFLGEGILDDDFLKGSPTNKLRSARNRSKAKNWKGSVTASFNAVRDMMDELGERFIPGCSTKG